MAETTAQSELSKTIQGTVPSLATVAERDKAMEQAFDYRGDVTIQTTDGRTIEGYVFDRRTGSDPHVRVMVRDSDERVNVKYAEIQSLIFSGRDTAAGKSWETWVKKHAEKKAKGEAASIESEPLE